jgi:hypothetical protein
MRGHTSCVPSHAMLTLDQKAHILRRAGVAVPVRPEMQMAAQQGGIGRPGPCATDPHRSWAEQLEVLYARYALERATRSLQQAEASVQMGGGPHPSQDGRSRDS